MTHYTKVRTALAPEEYDAGDTHQGINDEDKERVKRSQKAESSDWRHDEAEDETDYQPEHTKSCDGADRSLTCRVQPRGPTWKEAITPHCIDNACPGIDNG